MRVAWWCSKRAHPLPGGTCSRGGAAPACQGLRYRRSLCARRTATAGCTRRRAGGVGIALTSPPSRVSEASVAPGPCGGTAARRLSLLFFSFESQGDCFRGWGGGDPVNTKSDPQIRILKVHECTATGQARV